MRDMSIYRSAADSEICYHDTPWNELPDCSPEDIGKIALCGGYGVIGMGDTINEAIADAESCVGKIDAAAVLNSKCEITTEDVYVTEIV